MSAGLAGEGRKQQQQQYEQEDQEDQEEQEQREEEEEELQEELQAATAEAATSEIRSKRRGGMRRVQVTTLKDRSMCAASIHVTGPFSTSSAMHVVF